MIGRNVAGTPGLARRVREAAIRWRATLGPTLGHFVTSQYEAGKADTSRKALRPERDGVQPAGIHATTRPLLRYPGFADTSR